MWHQMSDVSLYSVNVFILQQDLTHVTFVRVSFDHTRNLTTHVCLENMTLCKHVQCNTNSAIWPHIAL